MERKVAHLVHENLDERLARGGYRVSSGRELRASLLAIVSTTIRKVKWLNGW